MVPQGGGAGGSERAGQSWIDVRQRRRRPQGLQGSVKWYRKAAEQGHADAQGRVGVHYYLGEGVLKDDVAAFVWFNLAAFNGAEDGPKARDSLAKEMTLAQIAEAKKLTKELLKKVEANKKKE